MKEQLLRVAECLRTVTRSIGVVADSQCVMEALRAFPQTTTSRLRAHLAVQELHVTPEEDFGAVIDSKGLYAAE